MTMNMRQMAMVAAAYFAWQNGVPYVTTSRAPSQADLPLAASVAAAYYM